MNREIKFRGKALNGEKWYYGSLIDYGDPAFCDIVRFNDDNEAIHECVDINTIGQFTGLHDKNGKEIYEGDIVKWTDEKDRMDKFLLCYVDWHKHLCKFYLSFGEEQKVNDSRTDIFEMMRMGYNYEVIGNIYDNPELLKGCEK